MKNNVKSLFLFIGMVAFALVMQGFSASEPSSVGKVILPFSLKNVDNTNVSFADFPNAKGFIMVFTCNHCPFAKLYTSRLNNLHRKYEKMGVPLLAVNPMDTLVYEEETFELMQQRAKSEHFAFPYLHDAMQTVGKSFNALHTPQAFVIWKERNNWVVKYSGAIDDNGAEPSKATSFVAKAVDELLQGKAVSSPKNKSIGCAIYYRK